METNPAATMSAPALIPHVIAVGEQLIAQMIAFGAGNYPPSDPNLDVGYLRWLCIENPCGNAQAVVIRADDRLVGQAILVPVNLATGDCVTRGYFVVNVLTDPEYRNRRLFSTIIDAAKEFVSGRKEWLLGHPNAAALPGWTRKEMTFRTSLAPHLCGMGFAIGRKVEVIDTEAGLMMEWPGIESCLGSNNDRQVRIVRTLEYMRWRFMRRPDKHYRLGMCRGNGGRPLGFYVATRWKHHLDLVVDHGRCNGSRDKLRVARPAIVMLPWERGRIIPSDVAAVRLPVRKTFPFFATTFVADELCFDDLTLAASDF